MKPRATDILERGGHLGKQCYVKQDGRIIMGSCDSPNRCGWHDCDGLPFSTWYWFSTSRHVDPPATAADETTSWWGFSLRAVAPNTRLERKNVATATILNTATPSLVTAKATSTAFSESVKRNDCHHFEDGHLVSGDCEGHKHCLFGECWGDVEDGTEH